MALKNILKLANTVASVAIPGYAPIGGMVGVGLGLMNSDEDPPPESSPPPDTGTKPLADVMSSTNKLNLASTGIAAAGAIGSLVNEANAKPQVFAPVVKENTVSLDKSASAMENAIESSADKTFKTGLSYLMDRGVSPTSAVTAMSAGRDKTITEGVINAENIGRTLENNEAQINAGIVSRNTQSMNALNRFKEQMQAHANQQASQNIGSSIATLAQLPANYGSSLMGNKMFELNLKS
jgi:hypothetical protein